MSKSVLEILIEARALILDPDHWTQGAWARTRLNSGILGVSPHNTDAVCWCAAGAISRVATTPDLGVAVFTALGGLREVTRTNDLDGHAEVIKMFDTKIAELRRL